MEEGSEAAGMNDADVVAATADIPAADETRDKGGGGGVAVAAENEQEEGAPTEEQLLEAIRGMPSSVQDITQLTQKQVRYRNYVKIKCWKRVHLPALVQIAE